MSFVWLDCYWSIAEAYWLMLQRPETLSRYRYYCAIVEGRTP